jgi:hypothetical protein
MRANIFLQFYLFLELHVKLINIFKETPRNGIQTGTIFNQSQIMHKSILGPRNAFRRGDPNAPLTNEVNIEKR